MKKRLYFLVVLFLLAMVSLSVAETYRPLQKKVRRPLKSSLAEGHPQQANKAVTAKDLKEGVLDDRHYTEKEINERHYTKDEVYNQSDVYTKTEVDTEIETAVEARLPAGMVMGWTTNTAPTGWLECDGSAVSRTTYADLFATIGTTYGNGDGSTTFNLPDYRGRFLRGYDHGAGTDPDAAGRTDRGDSTTGDNVGTKQADEYESHTHSENLYSGLSTTAGSYNYATAAGTKSFAQISISASGGNETRPTNIYVMWVIKT